MLGLISFIVAGAAAVLGYWQARKFVRRRLSFVDAIHGAYVPILAGLGAGAVAAPIVWMLPLVGTGTALLFGTGVGMGVAAGTRDIRRRLYPG